ncbi:hypothetical protein BD626DRAFT_632392, partial [Schizophyllum amplum]
MSLVSVRHRRVYLPLLRGRYVATNATNQPIVDMLKQNQVEEERKKDKNQFKARAFGLAVRIIEQVPFPIRNAKEVSQIEGIGPGITRRISEFLGEKDAVSKEARDRKALEAYARAELQQVHGIGLVRAKALVAAGCMSIADLPNPKYLQTLRPIERFGLKYHTHMQAGVQRHEVESIASAIRAALPPQFEVLLAGSYRRGAPVSSEVEVLLVHPQHTHVPLPPPHAHWRAPRSSITGRRRVPFAESTSGGMPAGKSIMLDAVVPALQAKGLLGDAFTQGYRKWQGMAKIAGTDDYRRLDISFVPVKSKGAGLIALTGDLEFNRHLRLKASKMELHLNEYGLWKWISTPRVDEDTGEATTHREPGAIDEISENPSAASDVSGELEGNRGVLEGNRSEPEGERSEPEGDRDEVEASPEPTTTKRRKRAKPSVSVDLEAGFWRLIRAETEEAIMRELDMEYVEPTKRNFAYVEKPPGWAKGRGRKKAGVVQAVVPD